MSTRALDPADHRTIQANVAGPRHYWSPRPTRSTTASNHREPTGFVDKGATDALRLMQTTSARHVGATLARLRADPTAGPATSTALDYLDTVFGRRRRPGIDMATRATHLAVPAEYVEALAVAYTATLTATARQNS